MKRLVWKLAVVLGLAAAVARPSMQAPPALVAPEVLAALADAGTAHVIVGVRTPFVPEGALADQNAVADQRTAMRTAVDTVMASAAAAGAVVGEPFETIPFFPARVDAAALAALSAMPEVTSIAADALLPPSLAESAPLINAPAAWAAGHTGAGWSVAVLDTGVEKTHSFFGGRIVSEACYSNAGGTGTSQGGSSVCPGGVTSSIAEGSAAPCTITSCDHGTHVAGIAAGASGPGGVNGVAPGASIIAIQVFTRFDSPISCSRSPCVLSFTSDFVRGLERTLLLAGAGNVNQVASVNLSLGGGGPYTSNCDTSQAATKAAIDNLRSIGVATVIASGNTSFRTGVGFPACVSTAVSVGSTTKADVFSTFTNRSGSMVHLLAPGGAITASVLGNGYGVKSGTSMAAPHVAGAWAVLKQAVPAASVTEVLTATRNSGHLIGDTLSGATYRRINVNAARLRLIAPGSEPGTPGTPTIGGSGNNIAINWTAPPSGGAPTSYTVLARGTAGGPVLTQLNVGNALGVNVPAPNGTFHITVLAANASGPGPESAGVSFSVPLVPPAPGTPTNLTATVSGAQVGFTWTAPSGGGTPAGYMLRAAASPGGAPIVTLPVPASPTAFAVAAPAGTYYVRIAAINAGGTGPLSNEVTVVVAPPGPPTMNAPTVNGATVGLSWIAPTTGGTGVTSYVVFASMTPGGAPVAQLPTTGLGINVDAPRGTYYVRVHARNAVGQGAASNEVTVTVP
ncbi:MAG: S8 family serine peptidase [Acidobacteria bacterium]|nr:S8 family serine peptidase [Acidobacteriota bacterium]